MAITVTVGRASSTGEVKIGELSSFYDETDDPFTADDVRGEIVIAAGLNIGTYTITSVDSSSKVGVTPAMSAAEASIAYVLHPHQCDAHRVQLVGHFKVADTAPLTGFYDVFVEYCEDYTSPVWRQCKIIGALDLTSGATLVVGPDATLPSPEKTNIVKNVPRNHLVKFLWRFRDETPQPIWPTPPPAPAAGDWKIRVSVKQVGEQERNVVPPIDATGDYFTPYGSFYSQKISAAVVAGRYLDATADDFLRVYKSVNKGVSWTKVQDLAGPAGSDMAMYGYRCFIEDPDTLNWLLAVDRVGGSLPDRIYQSKDGGATWSLVLSQDAGSKSFRWLAYDTVRSRIGVLQYDTAANNDFWYSDNGGDTWTKVANVLTGTARGIGPVYDEGNDLFIVHAWQAAKARKSTGGISWSNCANTFTSTDQMMGIFYDPVRVRVVVIQYISATNKVYVQWTGDALATAATTEPQASIGIPAHFFVDRSTGHYFVLEQIPGSSPAQTRLWVSEDGGTSWVAVKTHSGAVTVTPSGLQYAFDVHSDGYFVYGIYDLNQAADARYRLVTRRAHGV